jgi:Domain of unknown function (DUF4126)
MNEIVMQHIPDLAMAGALAWGAGLRLYLVSFLFGAAGALGWWPLPEHLHVLQHPLVMGSAGLMALIEMFADKLPWLDSVWDAMHTFIRIPAGAALAAAVFGDSGMAITAAAALLGGSLTATTHFAKSGTRAAANTSPEPFSNLALSLTEDVAVVGGTWLATQYPTAFLIALAIFLVLAVLVFRLLIRGARRLVKRLGATSEPSTGQAIG